MSASILQYCIISWIFYTLMNIRTDGGSTADILAKERTSRTQKLRHKGYLQKRLVKQPITLPSIPHLLLLLLS